MKAKNLLAIACLAAKAAGGGQVVAWGDNYSGEVTGIRTMGGATGIVSIAGQDVAGIAAGSGHSLALNADGTVVAWGGSHRTGGKLASADGQILRDVIAVSVSEHDLLLLRDGSVMFWDGKWRRPPFELTDAIAVAAGNFHYVALRNNKSLVSWGIGNSPPLSLTNVIAVAVSKSIDGHGLALLADRTVVAWALRHDSASKVVGATNVVAIAAGYSHYLALRGDGVVVEWGDYNPPLGGSISGLPATDLSCHPVTVGNVRLTNTVAIAAGGTGSIALNHNGTVITWGKSLSRRSRSPDQLTVPERLKGVVAVAVGDGFFLALTTNNPALPSPRFKR